MTLRDHSITSNGDINESKVSYLLLLYSCWCSLKMKSQLLKAEMKSLMKEQRQNIQYLYYWDYEGDQRKFSLVHFIYFPFLWYGVNKWN
ncbi:hypothetical protein ZEAMMB73_Zm00001d015823 [Zea mays]|jgi:hypothetical protein|uniref:Uncharacterized protein n=1 Tax=Zea mays TaxID=4577 RepID=A0A1D6H467_MAIZE|nr:hypothetical protein ZEAMMB73_Zm00001d015823 [Zea mays]